MIPTLCLAGFADRAAMYNPMKQTVLAGRLRLNAEDLPGFGGFAPLAGRTTLDALADHVAYTIGKNEVRLVIAHSVASIIASLAISRQRENHTTLISLEGNLTAEDAYFSGMAADYADPETFKAEFIAKIRERARNEPILERYADSAERANARAMWELGCDARRFSDTHHPGELLEQCGRVIYVHNPENCAQASMDWLARSSLEKVTLEGASHWPTIDAPDDLSRRLLDTLRRHPS